MNCRDDCQVRNIWLVTVVVLLHIRIRLTAGSAYVPESEFINISYYEDCGCVSFNDTNTFYVIDMPGSLCYHNHFSLHFKAVRTFLQYGTIRLVSISGALRNDFSHLITCDSPAIKHVYLFGRPGFPVSKNISDYSDAF